MGFRVWWLPDIPGEAFHVEVDSRLDGYRLLDALVDYTRYLEGRNLMPDYSADAGGLEMLGEDGEWEDVDEEWEWVYRGQGAE